jgi:hypothetical protein
MLPGLRDVPRDLLPQGLGRLKPIFFPQPTFESEIDLDPIEIP